MINDKNSFTKSNYKWWFDWQIYYNNAPLGFRPYNGLVGAFKDDFNYIFIVGNDIDGVIAGIKRLVSARELFFANLEKDKVSIIEDTDVAGIAVADLFRNPSNWPYYNQRDTQIFARVVERILNNNNFEISIKTVKTYNDNTTLRMKNVNTDYSSNFKDAIVKNSKPVAIGNGVWTSLNSLIVMARSIAQDPENTRDTWLIELTGGPNTECDTCPNYSYEDLTDYYWPALIAGVEQYSGQNTIDYVGYSNGCRVALDSLKNWSSGKNNAGHCFNPDTGLYDIDCDLAANAVDTFVGVACPGAFEGKSPQKTIFSLLGGFALNSFEENNIDHISTPQTYAELFKNCYRDGDVTSCGNAIYKLNIDEGDVSRNLLSYYRNIMLSDNDPQPGTGLSLNKLVLINGKADLGFFFNFLFPNNDELVTLSDQDGIYDAISSSDKSKKTIPNTDHIRMIDSDKSIKEVKEAIK